MDTSEAPLLVARFPDAPSVADVDAFCSEVERFLAAPGERFGWVTDLSQLRSVGAVQRKRFVDANRSAESRLAERAVAIAVFAPSPFQRGLVTLYSWFLKSPFPFKVFADLDEAKTWVRGHLASVQS